MDWMSGVTVDGLYDGGSIIDRGSNFFVCHPASYPVGAGGSFPDGKVAGAWSWPLTSF
jgi:hypothetical protein